MNRAVAILYARRLLVELCAHWPKETADRRTTVLAALGCSDEQYLPFVLDLLYTDELTSKLQPVCSLRQIYCCVCSYRGSLLAGMEILIHLCPDLFVSQRY